MVLDVLKGFGDLHSIFSFSGTNKMLCMAGISRSELGWMATRGLWKVIMMFAGNHGHSRLINTSYLRDPVSRFPRIKEKEVVVELTGDTAFMMGGG